MATGKHMPKCWTCDEVQCIPWCVIKSSLFILKLVIKSPYVTNKRTFTQDDCFTSYVAPAARPWTRRIAFIWPLVSRPTVSADACQNTADNFMGVGTTLLVTETSHNVCVCYLIWIANGCACLPQRGAHALTLPQHYVFQELRQLLFCKGNSNEFVINVQITCQGRYWLISWYQCTITWGDIKGAPIFQ